MNPVQAAQFIQHGPLDAELGIGLEVDMLAQVIFLDGIDEADNAGAKQVILGDMGGQA